MYEHQSSTSSQYHGAATTGERVGPEWAERATTARQQEWTPDGVVDQGDSHDKGEASLCVGEAA